MSIVVAAVVMTQQTAPTTVRYASQVFRDFVCMYMPTTHKADNDGKSSDTPPAKKNLETLSFKETENKAMLKSTKTQIATYDKRLEPNNLNQKIFQNPPRRNGPASAETLAVSALSCCGEGLRADSEVTPGGG